MAQPSTKRLDWPTLPPLPDADITVVGLGPGAPADLTLAAWQALAGARRLLLRTGRHPLVAALEEQRAMPPYETCDDLYEAHDEFASVYAAIAARVLELGRQPGGVVYAVPGSPWVGEATTRMLLSEAAGQGLTMHIVDGGSFIAPALAAAGVDALDGAQIVDAMLLARQHHPRVEVSLPLLIGQLYARWLASDVKLTLLNAYPDDHPVTLISAAGTERQTTQQSALFELDHGESFDHLTSLYVPPLAQGGSVSDLQEIVAHLRAPEGCPWDQEQTLESLRQDLLGEAVEVLEAIDAEADGDDNSAHIAEELGDLLLLVAMMAQIATEEGRFRMGDVTHSIVAKLIRRHPHVFGDVAVRNVAEVWSNWDAIKAQEKADKGQSHGGPLDGVPPALPALEKARKLQSKAAKAGLLDREDLLRAAPSIVKILGETPSADKLGDVLWRLVAAASKHGLNAEDALRAYTVRFRKEAQR